MSGPRDDGRSDVAAVDAWYGSPAYQALVALRDEAADVSIACYAT